MFYFILWLLWWLWVKAQFTSEITFSVWLPPPPPGLLMLWFHNCRQITENCPTTPRKNCPGKTQKYPHENQRSPSRHQHARCACPASPCQGTPEHQHFISELTKRAHALKAHQTIMSDNRLARSDLRDPRHNQAKPNQSNLSLPIPRNLQ